jgi:exopolysaccharide biosynthesis polyprenyl glycosylphosphotransferase
MVPNLVQQSDGSPPAPHLAMAPNAQVPVDQPALDGAEFETASIARRVLAWELSNHAFEAGLLAASVFLPVIAVLQVSGSLSGVGTPLLVGLTWTLSLKGTLTWQVKPGPNLIGVRLAIGTLLGLAAVSLLGSWFPESHLAPRVLAYTAAAVFMSSIALQEFLKTVRPRPRVLVIGAGYGGADLVRELNEYPEVPFDCVGIVDDGLNYVPTARAAGTPDGLRAAIAQKRPDIVVLTEAPCRQEALEILFDMPAPRFRIVGLHQFYERAFGRVPVRYLSGVWFMSVLHLYQRTYHRITKRMFDMAIAGLLLIPAAPVMLVAALLVRRSGPGPVFFRQARLGECGRTFDMFKLRTMNNGAEKRGQPVWADENDPRITKVGRFLRLSRVDEVPQLLNVFRGEMSVVGPRPERPEFLEKLADEVPYWARRHLVKPGITGWAQIHAGYAADVDSSTEKLAYDLFYLRHRGILLDLAIVLKTARIVLTGVGAR